MLSEFLSVRFFFGYIWFQVCLFFLSLVFAKTPHLLRSALESALQDGWTSLVRLTLPTSYLSSTLFLFSSAVSQRSAGNVARLCHVRSRQFEPWINSSTPTVSAVWAAIAPCRACSSTTGTAAPSVRTAIWWGDTHTDTFWVVNIECSISADFGNWSLRPCCLFLFSTEFPGSLFQMWGEDHRPRAEGRGPVLPRSLFPL